MTDDSKLKIALEALLKVRNLSSDDLDDYFDYAELIVGDALREIWRDHCLNTPSPVVAEVLGAGVKV